MSEVRREVVVAGSRLETCRFGAETGPLRIVLLHEGLGSVAMWRDFPARLAAQLDEPVLAYSRAGYGQSSLPEGPRDPRFMHREAQVVLPALLQAFDVSQPILVGHSDGASIALIHAGSPPAALPAGAVRPAGVAVLAPHLFVEAVTVAEIARIREGFEASGLGPRLARYHRDPAATFHGWAAAWLSDDFRQWNIESEVAAIACPLLAIQGEDDQYGTALQIDRLVKHNARARALLLPACRHSPHAEQPSIVLAALTGFVAGLGCSRTTVERPPPDDGRRP